ncbi:putative P-loop containing nucleoside triphosphate hydrolase [Helianthus anomalus]
MVFSLIRREALVYNTPNDHAEASSGSVLGRTAEMTATVLRKCKFALFLIDARDGLQPMDLDVGKWLRKHAPENKIITVMNKAESLDDGFGSVISVASEAARTLRFGDPVALSAETGLGMNDLYDVFRPLLEQQHMLLQIQKIAFMSLNFGLLAFVGWLNVGKSTLLNAILQEERVLWARGRLNKRFGGHSRLVVEDKVRERSIILMRAHVVALVLNGQEVSKARKSLTHDDAVVIVKRAYRRRAGLGLVWFGVVVSKMDVVEERLYDRVVKAVPQEIETIIPQVSYQVKTQK